MEQCEHGNIDLSDHAPVMVTIQINSQVGNTLWRLNSSILNNMPFKTQIKKEIEQFLKENINGEVASEIVWDTLKAVLRGKIISYCARKKKERQLRLVKLNEELGELETKHKKDLNANVAVKLKDIRMEINTFYTQEIQKNMIYTKQKYYEAGTKFAKFLARKLQKQKADSTIYKIRDPDTKTLVLKREEIQTAFQKYYNQLYTQPQ